MNIITIMIIGALQGILEWIPISSQGIITIILTMLGETNAIDYAIFLHGGTALAAIIHYRKEFKTMLTKGTLLGFTVTVTLLTLLIGAPLYLLMNNMNDTSGLVITTIIAIALLTTGTLQLKKKKQDNNKKTPNKKDAITTGIMQGLSVIPGISRSGMTISTLLFKGFKPEKAIQLSFLLSVPAVLTAEIGLGILKGEAVYNVNGLIGLSTAFLTGLIGIKAMTKIAEKINFGKFCIIIATLMMISVIIRLF